MRVSTNSYGMPDQAEVNALELLAKTKVVSYRESNWLRNVGLIVDGSLATELPHAVELCSGGGTVTHLEGLIPVMIKAIQELSEKVEALSKKPPAKKAKEKVNVP